jgi:acetylornithine/N-succinyldiaminopimelate aminotransferase
MQGLRCNREGENLKIVAALRENGLLAVGAADNVVRFLPPLIINESHVDEAAERLTATLKAFQ